MTDLERLREIKPLAWEETYCERGDGHSEVSGWEAENGFGAWYAIEQYFGSDSYGWQAKFDHEIIGDSDDPAKAKSIAQAHYEARIRAALSAPAQGDAEAVAWRPIETAPKDGTHILAILVREGVHDIDDIWRAEFREVREIWYRPYEQFGMFMPWHAGDPFDAHDGVAPENMGEGIPKFWMPLSSLKTGDRSPSPAPEAEKLREALRPFAKAAGIIEWTEKVTHQSFDGNAPFKSGLAWQEDGETRTLTYDDFRRARAALKEKASEAE